MYEGIIKTGFRMSQAEFDTQVQFLGREPDRHEDFVQQLAAEWKQLSAEGIRIRTDVIDYFC